MADTPDVAVEDAELHELRQVYLVYRSLGEPFAKFRVHNVPSLTRQVEWACSKGHTPQGQEPVTETITFLIPRRLEAAWNDLCRNS